MGNFSGLVSSVLAAPAAASTALAPAGAPAHPGPAFSWHKGGAAAHRNIHHGGIATGGSPQVAAVQGALAAHGFDPGVNHGFLDFKTRHAITSFQRARGIPPTPAGQIDAPTLTALAGGTAPTSPHFSLGGRSMNAGASNRAVGMWSPTGLRVPLVLAQTITANSTATVTQNPQMDFRGENFIIDPTVIGPNCTVTVPTVGTTPQVAGGPSGTGVPGTIFSPTQNNPMDFSMMISNQGNAVAVTVQNTQTSLALNFASLLFGQEVGWTGQNAPQHHAFQSPIAGVGAGMAPAGSFGGMAPAGTFGGRIYGGRR